MPRLATFILILPLIAACATHADKVRNSVAAVVQDESARATVIDAINKGATPDEAMDKVSGGPAHQKPGPQ